MYTDGTGARKVPGPFSPLGKLGTLKCPGIELVGCVDQCVQTQSSAVEISDIKGATSRFAHLERFSLIFSSSSFGIRGNLLHP